MSSTPPSNGKFFTDEDQPVEPALAPAPPSLAPDHLAEAPPGDTAESQAPPMRDVPLGTLIFRAGLLAEEELEDALQASVSSGKRLGEVLLERGLLDEHDLGRMLAGQKGLPFIELNGLVSDPAALEAYPEDRAKLQGALPIRFEDGLLVVAVADPSNELVVENLRRTLGYDPHLVVAAHGDLRQAISEAYGNPSPPVQVAAPADRGALVQPSNATGSPEDLEPAPATVTPMPMVLPLPEARTPEDPAPPAELPALLRSEPPLPLRRSEPELPAFEVEPPVLEPAPFDEVPSEPATEPEPEQADEPELLSPLAPPPAGDVLEEPVAEAEPPVLEELVPLLQPVKPPGWPSTEPVQQPPEAASDSELEAVAATHFVLLRLSDGEQLEIGMFGTAEEARDRAEAVVGEILAAESQASWPFFADRFLRPDTIASIDLIDEPAGKWMGSKMRSHWDSE